MLQPAGQHVSTGPHCMFTDAGLSQTPFAQVVPAVQPFASSHATPSFAGCPGAHCPAAHTSPLVQKFASSHAAPSFPGSDMQEKLNSSHTPTRHGLSGGAHGLG